MLRIQEHIQPIFCHSTPARASCPPLCWRALCAPERPMRSMHGGGHAKPVSGHFPQPFFRVFPPADAGEGRNEGKASWLRPSCLCGARAFHFASPLSGACSQPGLPSLRGRPYQLPKRRLQMVMTAVQISAVTNISQILGGIGTVRRKPAH